MAIELFDIEVVLWNALLKLCFKTTELANFDQLTSRRIFGGNKMNFKNTKEVIVNHRPRNINLFHFLHRCHGLGDLKESLSPMFSVFLFSCSRHVFVTPIAAR
jgi:hypothetical protein